MITFARNNHPQEKFPNFSFTQLTQVNLLLILNFMLYFQCCSSLGKDLEVVLKGFWKSLKLSGVFLAQFGGSKNASKVLKIIDSMLENENWSSYFRDFVFPSGFYGLEEYGKWLKDAGFSIKHLELNSKDMALEEKKTVARVASTWHPYHITGILRVKRGFYK